jgi:glycosyltransferase involved in cell wall biosynthesis
VAHHEGFGFPALEAMACGAPVVSSMTGAMRDTLGDAAMTADPDSAQSIADAVAAVVSGAALRDRLRQEGLRRAADFRWERFSAELRQTYMIACRKPGDRGPIAANR